MLQSGFALPCGAHRRWWTPRISGSRVAGGPVAGLAADQGGSAPGRAAAPGPRAGSPARTGMLIAALGSAWAWNPQAPRANTACDGRFDWAVCPHRQRLAGGMPTNRSQPCPAPLGDVPPPGLGAHGEREGEGRPGAVPGLVPRTPRGRTGARNAAQASPRGLQAYRTIAWL